MTESQFFQREVGGRNLIIDTGRLAGQANAAVTIRYGDTVVLVTACINPEPREGIDFLPLTIDYEERLYAAGKIPGGFIRREGRPTQEATLAGRLTDRPLRPLLPKELRNEIQLIITVLSVDQENDPDILAVIGSSAVLSISEIPFAGPISAVRIGWIDNQLVLNPTLAQLEDSLLDLVVASTKKATVMVEAGAKEVPEDIVIEAIRFGHEANQGIIELQEELGRACGKPKFAVPKIELNPELNSAVKSITDGKLAEILGLPSKQEREEARVRLKNELVSSLEETFAKADITAVFEAELKQELRSNILSKSKRVGGRGPKDVRPIDCQVGLLPRTHGSALFNRGETQVLSIITLGSLKKEQPLDGLGIEEKKRFIHHYNFAPFSTGEVKRTGTPGRREIGHGALAERALLPIMPEDEFPYTIRLVSEVLSSSGSTSMGSACAGSLALMDAGIPIKRAVAGIAMGLITAENGEYVILTDIEGWEDAFGDMDFKVAGTSEGITALQMDMKLKGIDIEILGKAMYQAGEARQHILETMQEAISSPRPQISSYAPQIYKMTVPPDKIGTVIGGGGKTIRSIIEETKTAIDVLNDGTILIDAPDAETAQRAVKIIEALTQEVEAGNTYTGKVMRIMNFGAFVEILPGKEGLVHISELADYRVANVEDIVRVGDEITVKVTDIDHMGRINLSRRAVLQPQADVPADNMHDSSSRQPFRKPSASDRPRDSGFHHSEEDKYTTNRKPPRRPFFKKD